MRILVLYDSTQTFTNTVYEHLASLATVEGAQVRFAHLRPESRLGTSLDLFDCVVIHYSVRVAYEMFSLHDANLIIRFRGLKVLFIQDEYDFTERARRWIEAFGMQLVFTCVPQEHREVIYPTARFPDVTFISNLTGYVPAGLGGRARVRPLADRRLWIGYRGRRLPPWYGALGREKWEIGQRMRAECERRGIPVDIEWDESARIYGDGWYDFLESSRATLGTESGSNIFDDEGALRATIQARLSIEPDLPFEVLHEEYLAGAERTGLMNQVSPKIFEAIAARTALILYEGTYSGVVEPGVHYLSLRKDFSNVEEVLSMLADDALLARMTTRAFDDVIASGRYGYPAFAAIVSRALRNEIERRPSLAPSRPDAGPLVDAACRAGAITAVPVRVQPVVTAGEALAAGDLAAIQVAVGRLWDGPPFVFLDAAPLPVRRFLNVVVGLFWAAYRVLVQPLLKAARPLTRQIAIVRHLPTHGARLQYVLMPVWLRVPERLRERTRPLARQVLKRMGRGDPTTR